METIPVVSLLLSVVLQAAMEFRMRSARPSCNRRYRPWTGRVTAALKGSALPLGLREMRNRHPVLTGGQSGRSECFRFPGAGIFVFKGNGSMTLRAQQP